MFILSTKTNGKVLIYEKPSAHKNKEFSSIGFTSIAQITVNLTASQEKGKI